MEAISRFVASRHGLTKDERAHKPCRARRCRSTALGQGFAIPHARVPGLSRRLRHLFDGNSDFVRCADCKPVSDLLVVPVLQHATEAHLLLLAEAAAMFC